MAGQGRLQAQENGPYISSEQSEDASSLSLPFVGKDGVTWTQIKLDEQLKEETSDQRYGQFVLQLYQGGLFSSKIGIKLF